MYAKQTTKYADIVTRIELFTIVNEKYTKITAHIYCLYNIKSVMNERYVFINMTD